MVRLGPDDNGCRDPKYPIRIGALCYPKCKEGYHAVGTVCWQDKKEGSTNMGLNFSAQNYFRPPGTVPVTCPAGTEKYGALCYEKPGEEGLEFIGGRWYKKCPPELHNQGLFCGKPKSYGRSVGGAKAGCEKKYGTGNCESWGGLWYQKCRPGFHNFLGNVCSPNCPAGWTDIGASCAKPSKNAKIVHAECPPGKERLEGLCYTPCKKGWKVYDYTKCHIDCSPGRYDGSTCIRDSYVLPPKPLSGSGIIALIVTAIVVTLAFRIGKKFLI